MRQHKFRYHSGFTLLEMMIVISIMAMMATFALPSYQERIIKTQIAEGLAMIETIQLAQTEFYRRYGRLAKDNQELGLPSADKFVGNYVAQVQVDAAAIHITLGQRVNKNIKDKIVTIRPAIVNDAPIVPISWVCAKARVPKGMAIQGIDLTNVSDYHLPLECLH